MRLLDSLDFVVKKSIIAHLNNTKLFLNIYHLFKVIHAYVLCGVDTAPAFKLLNLLSYLLGFR